MGAGISRLWYSQFASPMPPKVTEWEVSFLNPLSTTTTAPRALIILNQPFSKYLLKTLWSACTWRCCADGGGNRLFDLLEPEQTEDSDLERTKHVPSHGSSEHDRQSCRYLPDLIKGDLDSLRADVKEYYSSKGVPVLHDPDQDSTDLMKCVQALEEKEKSEGQQYEVVVLGGLSGRLDQTAHTLSYLHKLRQTRSKVYAVTDDNIAWVLDEGEHRIHIDHAVLGVTCGIIPFGVDSTILSTSGLRWNLDEAGSSFDGLVSTSNHLVLEEPIVTIKTSRPIWWCAELRKKD